MFKFISISIFCFSYLITNTAMSEEESGNYEVSGIITDIQQVEAQRKDNYEEMDNIMGSMFGPLGWLVSDVLGTEQRAYNIYQISTLDNRVFNIASRSSYNKNDCVKVIYPKVNGETPDIGIEANIKLESSKECI